MVLQGQIWNLLYLSQKWFDCHETKSKHIDWILCLKWDHRVWPWPWHWPCIFKVKYGICYISAKKGPIATKQKTNISIKIWASNETIGFDLDHDLKLSRSNMEFAISQLKMVSLPRNKKQTYRLNSMPQIWPWPWKVRCEDLTNSDQGDYRCRRAIDSSSYIHTSSLPPIFCTVKPNYQFLKNTDKRLCISLTRECGVCSVHCKSIVWSISCICDWHGRCVLK